MIRCVDCGKQISEDHIVYCDVCGAPLCEEGGTSGWCSTCTELWESEIDVEDRYFEDIEAEEE